MFRHFKQIREAQKDEYLGNIWGWKVSYIGLGLLLFLIALYFYRVTFHPLPVKIETETKIEQSIKE